MTSIGSVSVVSKNGSFRWFGHVEHQALYDEVDGVRQLGHPQKTW